MYRPSEHLEKIPRLESLPNIDDITSVLEQARQTPGKDFELSWEMGTTGDIYRLAAGCSHDSSEPTWNLLIGEGRDEIQVWSYQTGDVALVLNLVLSESTDSMSQAMDQNALLGQTDTRNTGLSGSYSTSLLGLSSLTSTNQNIPVFTHEQKIGRASMEGTLEDWPIPTLLQSINMGKRTGKLQVISDQSVAELFFDQGELKHASAMNQQGEEAIMELVTWEEGKFYFYNDEVSEMVTVQRRIDAILMESVTLLDQSKYLMSTGFEMESYLIHKNPNLTEAQFEESISRGAPCDKQLQKQFYLRLDGNTTMFDMLRERPMIKKEWVPIMFNMLQCELVTLSKKALRPDKTSHLTSIKLDRNAIDGTLSLLTRNDTGLYTFSSFQYFLEQEFVRYKYSNAPFTVISFELGIRKGGKVGSLSTQEVATFANRIKSVMRPIDIAAHFETLSYAVLLPNTESASAAIFVHRVVEVLRSKGLSAGMDPNNLVFAFGIANVPEDCKDVGLLLSASKVAKKVAQSSAMPIVMFKDLQAPQE